MPESLRNAIDAYGDIIEGIEELDLLQRSLVSRSKGKLRLLDGSMLSGTILRGMHLAQRGALVIGYSLMVKRRNAWCNAWAEIYFKILASLRLCARIMI